MPTQTPASRKFVPPSSASTNRPPSRPGFSTRFVHPSQTPSSSVPRTLFSSAVAKQGRFEIDVDDFSDGDVADDHATDHTISKHSHQDVVANDASDEDDLLPDVGPSLRTAGGPTTILTQQTPSFAPLTAKRRKLSHFTADLDNIDNDETFLSSSPPSADLADINQVSNQDVQVQIPRSSPEIPYPDETPTAPQQRSHGDASSDYLPSDDSPVRNIVTPKLKSSRFRHPPLAQSATPQPYHSTDQPYPSFQSRLLGASASASAFALRGPAPSLDYTLPDAFSPSRRKGQKAYVHGGHAETVRGWVLDVAARAGDGGEQVSGRRGEEMDESGLDGDSYSGQSGVGGQMVLDMILLQDPDGRFAVVRLLPSGNNTAQPRTETTRDREVWMLINTDSRPSSRHSTSTGKLEMLQPGVKIMVKGGEAVRWNLGFNGTLPTPIPLLLGHTGTRPLVSLSAEQAQDDSRCHVAVLWDVVQ